MSFQTALDFVFREEGGYSNDPADHGGATNFGITQATYSNWLAKKRMLAAQVNGISRATAEQIYLEEYWTPSGCNSIPDRLGVVQFDTAVNCGVGMAVRFLQRSVGTDADGNFGPMTMDAANKVDEDGAIHAYIIERDEYYQDIVAHDPEQSRFLKGWQNRLAALQDYLEGLQS